MVEIRECLVAVDEYLGTIQMCLEAIGVDEVMASETGEILEVSELSRVRGILDMLANNEAFELR